MSKIEDLIGDREVLKILLEGFLAQWNGTFDVMPADSPPTYLFEPRTGFAGVCGYIRSAPIGEDLCIQCDREYAEQARKLGKPIHYLCHAGMLDIAVPILLEDGELIATIFCGQSRLADGKSEAEALARLRRTAHMLGADPFELIKLRSEAPSISLEDVETVKERLWKVATYMARTGQEKVELKKMRAEAVREGELIQSLVAELSSIVDINTFWLKLGRALTNMCSVIGAAFAAFFVCEHGVSCEQGNGATFLLKAAGGLDLKQLRSTYPNDQEIFEKAVSRREPFSMPLGDTKPGTLCYDLLSVVERPLDTVAVIPFELSGDDRAIMLIFLESDRDRASGLPIATEMTILSQVSPQIATAYENCLLYTRQQELAREKDVFLEDVGHQLISPLSGIQADSDRLFRYLDRWDEDRIINQVLAIRGTSRWAARLTRNLVWVATTGRHTLQSRRFTEMTGFLIGCAIDVQGMAAYKGMQVHVEKSRTSSLPMMAIDRERFTQAIVNLLDNAVKYAKPASRVVVDACVEEGEARILITNYGIPLREEEIDQVFDRGYRTAEARLRVPGGTGIGLSVARDIVELHGGKLVATPSVFDREQNAHKVVFSVTLPIKV